MSKYSIVNGNVRQNNTGREYRFEKLNMMEYEGQRFTNYTRLAYYLLYGQMPEQNIGLIDPSIGFVFGNFKTICSSPKINYSNKFEAICLNLCRIYKNKPNSHILEQFETSWRGFELRNPKAIPSDKIAGHLLIVKFIASRPSTDNIKEFIKTSNTALMDDMVKYSALFDAANTEEVTNDKRYRKFLIMSEIRNKHIDSWKRNPLYKPELLPELLKQRNDAYSYDYVRSLLIKSGHLSEN